MSARPDAPTPGRPIVFRRGAMGDMVIVLSLVTALSRRYGSPVDVVSSGSWTRPLLAGQPGVGEVHVLGSSRTPWPFSAAQREFVRAIARRGPGPVWYCDGNQRALRLLRRAGIGPDHVVWYLRDCPILSDEHHVDHWLRFALRTPPAFASAVDPGPTDFDDLRSPPLQVPAAARADVEQWLAAHGWAGRPLVLVQAGNKRTMRWWAPRDRATNRKYWPEARWGAVLRRVLDDDPDRVVLLLGVPAEAGLNDDIAAATAHANVHNVARELPMARLLALQAVAAGMISVDTGPAHSAAALGCPLVVLFGEAAVHRYAPRSPTGRVVCLQAPEGDGGRRIAAIGVDEVLAAWRRVTAPAAQASLVAAGQ